MAAFVLFFLRLIASEGRIAEPNPEIRNAYYIVAYIAPASIFILCFLCLFLFEKVIDSSPCPSAPLANGLFWAVLALFIHNLIEFAIFETAVMMGFWAFVAALIALTGQQQEEKSPEQKIRPAMRIFGGIGIATLFSFMVFIALIPVIRSGRLVQLALRKHPPSVQLLEQAAKADPLSHKPPLYLGQTLSQKYLFDINTNDTQLNRAAEKLIEVTQKNPAHFMAWESLMHLYQQTGEQAKDLDKKERYLQKAYTYGQQAHQCYPGADRVAFSLGQVAEKLGKKAEAIHWYALAIKIEDAYQEQFKIMYPDYDMFSRLGPGKYEYARQYIEKFDKKNQFKEFLDFFHKAAGK